MTFDNTLPQAENQINVTLSGENIESAPKALVSEKSIAESGVGLSQSVTPPPAQDSPVDASFAPAKAVTTDTPTTVVPEVTVDDTAELSGDRQFIGEVKKIIHDHHEMPFDEEQDSEELQKRYLASRFGVDVSLDKEAK